MGFPIQKDINPSLPRVLEAQLLWHDTSVMITALKGKSLKTAQKYSDGTHMELCMKLLKMDEKYCMKRQSSQGNRPLSS